VNRRFVTMTERALDELMNAGLAELDLVAIMIDGVHFAEPLCVVALGITTDGTKIRLGFVEGSTEELVSLDLGPVEHGAPPRVPWRHR